MREALERKLNRMRAGGGGRKMLSEGWNGEEKGLH